MGAVGGLPLLQRETRQMKTLVNKNNPAIRIIAPEEAVKERPSCWAIWPEGYKGCRSLLLDKDEWTLVEEEPKHTEVWVEGRTIFEQDAKKPEVELEQAAGDYIVQLNGEDLEGGFNAAFNAFKAGAEWQKQRDKEWVEAKEKEFKDIRDTTRWVNRDLGYNDGFEAGKERAFKQFSDILDKWEVHATEGMRVGASAYHQGKIALICDLRDWIKEQTQK